MLAVEIWGQTTGTWCRWWRRWQCVLLQIIILCDPQGFRVAVDGRHLLDYKHRVQDLKRVTQLEVLGDISLLDVQIVWVFAVISWRLHYTQVSSEITWSHDTMRCHDVNVVCFGQHCASWEFCHDLYACVNHLTTICPTAIFYINLQLFTHRRSPVKSADCWFEVRSQSLPEG